MKDELCGDAASPLDRLLVERVTASWLQTAYFDALVAQAAGANEATAKRALVRKSESLPSGPTLPPADRARPF